VRPLPGRTLFLLAVVAAVLWLGYLARAVVTPLLAALLLAYVLDPVVRRLQRFGLSRWAASAVVVVLTVAVFVGATALTATRLVGEAKSFYGDVIGEPAVQAENEADARAKLKDDLPERAADAPLWFDGASGLWYVDVDGDGKFTEGYARKAAERLRTELKRHDWAAGLEERLEKLDDVGKLVAGNAGEWLRGAADTTLSVARIPLVILTLTVLFPIYLYYSLANLAWVYDVGVRHLPAGHRDRIVEILGKIHETLSAFFRGRLILLVVRFAVLLALFVAFDVPFAGVCALVSTVASLVPVLGSVVGGAVPVLLCVAQGWEGPKLVGILAAIAAWEAAEQYLLTPAIIGKRVGLHPLTILVATFVAGDLLGIFGMLVAIPLAAVLKILAIEYVLPEVRRQAGLAPATESSPEIPE